MKLNSSEIFEIIFKILKKTFATTFTGNLYFSNISIFNIKTTSTKENVFSCSFQNANWQRQNSSYYYLLKRSLLRFLNVFSKQKEESLLAATRVVLVASRVARISLSWMWSQLVWPRPRSHGMRSKDSTYMRSYMTSKFSQAVSLAWQAPE